jgi:DNA-directed RNA polymerase beta' subunit
LSTKQKAQHDIVGLKRPNVLLDQQILQRQSHQSREGEDAEMHSNSDIQSDSEEGEDVFSDIDDSRPEVSTAIQQLPKSASGKIKTARGRNERVMAAEECRAHLRRLFANEPVMCSLLFGRHGPFAPLTPHKLSLASPDIFFLEAIPVTPTRFRPPAKMNDMLFEHNQNELLARVITTSYRLRDLNENLRAASAKGSTVEEAVQRRLLQNLLDTLIQLQVDVNSFMDSSKNPAPVRQGKLPPAGVKQLLEKKEGLFRKNMMVFNFLPLRPDTTLINFSPQGKRVNYAARSVISPDVNIEPNEIGIPPVFARKLTFPEPVTAANFHELRALVIAGPNGYPGATMVEHEDGHLQYLASLFTYRMFRR